MKNFWICFMFLFVHIIYGQTAEINIIKKPINYSKERVELSLQYLKDHYQLNQEKPTINPKIIVLHYTAGGTLESNFRYFNNLYLEKQRSFLNKESTLNVSSQFLIDRDGSIYQLMEPNMFARHTIGLNYCAIGIENVGGKKMPLTEKQVNANAQLIRYLTKKYNIEYLIGHSEYGNFRNTSLWKEIDPKYFTGKEDPGQDFMKKVRNLVLDLKLKSKPE